MFLKNRNISSKIKRSKVTDYEAFKKLNFPLFFQNATDRATLVNIVNIISELLGKTRE